MAALKSVSENLLIWQGQPCFELLTPTVSVPPFDRAVMSWNCSGSANFYVQSDTYAPSWPCSGEWSATPKSAKHENLNVDTVILNQPSKSLRVRAEGSCDAGITLIAVTHWLSTQKYEFSANRSAAWGKIFNVPQRSQMIEEKDARSICSPTSLAMVLEYYGINRPTREIADGVFDHAEKIYGNWSFNVALAHTLLKSPCYVRKAVGLEELEAEIVAGRPVIASHRWGPSDLDNAPLEKSSGHLIVVVGFTADGDVIVNDPAGVPGEIRRVYNRRQFHRTFLELGSGIYYFISAR